MLTTLSNAQTATLTPLDPNIALFNSRRVRRCDLRGEAFFAAVDVVGRLADATEERDGLWARLRERLMLSPAQCAFDDEVLDGLTRREVLRVAAAMDSHAARRVTLWLADRAAKADELEAAVGADLQARRTYDRRGEDRPWIDKRQSAKHARRELAGEWAAHGVADSDQFRQLTNALFESTFGMDVAGYRHLKGLRPADNLRDHMSDVELTLTLLAESLAVQVLRQGAGHGFEAVLAATTAAGRAAAAARVAIEAQVGQVSTNANHAGPRVAA